MSNYNRPIIPYGNSFYINIELKQFNKDSGEYEYFDITTCHDVKVNLICAQHNTVIPLQFELLEGFNYILKCFVDYRLLHTTSYGVMVEGLNADNIHWRWTMLPKEGLLVVNNTSGMNIPDDVTTVDLAGRVGWGIQTDADLTNYYTKTEVNTLLENVEVDLDDYYTKSEVDGKLDDKQETLESGVNIKTVNGESILGAGNIEIQGVGEQVQSDWNETDTTSPAYIQNKPDIQSIEGNIADVQNDIDNLEDDIAAQQAEISGVQTAISGHQTALENHASEISGIQSAISGHQTAIENLDTEKQDVLESGVNIKTINNESILGEGNITIESGVDVEPAKIVVTDEEVADPDPDAVYIVQKPINLKTINGEEIVGTGDIEIEADTSEIEEQLSGIQTVVAGHQSAIESQATEISGIQTVIAGHQTALENQSSVDPGFIKVTNPSNSNKVGLVNSLTTNYNTNIGNKAVIEGSTSGMFQIEASGNYSHAEGYDTRAQALCAHAEGEQTMAVGNYSHAEGYRSSAQGAYSHAEGWANIASGECSHAEGFSTNSKNYAEHVSGQYNSSPAVQPRLFNGSTTAIVSSIGNGASEASRHNAFEVRQNGDIYYADTEKIDGSTVHYYDAPMIKLQDAISGIQSNISGIQSGVADVQNDIDNLEDDIAAQQAEISGVQTAISGHQTAIQNQATEISGIQSNISGMQTEISGIQTVVAGHQTAIQNQAAEISGMQTVLAGHQTALENQSGGGPDYHIYVRWNLTSDGIFYFGIELLDSDYHYVKRYTNGSTGGGFNRMMNDLPNYGLGLTMGINGVSSSYFNFEYSTYGFKATLPYTTNNVTMDYGSRITFDICKYNGSYNDVTYVYDHFDIQIPLDKNTLVTSTTTNGLKIEVVSALPASPDANTIYIIQ